MKGIIINADDFGLSESVNQAIAKCFREGLVTSTTLLVNMPCTESAVRIAKENSFFDKVGLHFNLTVGKPLSKQIRKSRMFVGCDGDFNGKFHLNTKTRLYVGRENEKLILEELCAQVERYLSYGFDYLHMDSHHHVHNDWVVFQQVRRVFKQYGMGTLRISRNINISSVRGLKVFYKKIYNQSVRRLAGYSTDLFGDFNDYLQDNIQPRAYNTLELMCHPDLVDDTLINQAVEDSLCKDFYSFMGNLEGIRRISYTDLKA